MTTDMAGSDTTIALVQEFILAMIKHPEIQKRCQEEIDEVIIHGKERLPCIAECVYFNYTRKQFY